MNFSAFISKILPRKKGTRIAFLVLLLLGLLGSVFTGKFVDKLVSSMTIIKLPGVPVDQSSQVEEPDLPDTTGEEVGFKPINTTSEVEIPEPWDGKKRVNLLFMGLDYRDWEAGELPRTDTMILFSFDPINNSASMISIPRDLWVSIPGFDYEKINTAYFLGEAYKMPGGGPGLAIKTVEHLLGIPIDYYLQLDFYAFVKFIDHIDGVKVNVPKEIDIVLMETNEIVTLPPGPVVIPGDMALAYARARYTEGGDFDRAQRQQQIIMGVLDRITEFKMFPKMVANFNLLYADLSAGIHTNVGINDGMRLASSVLQIPKENIRNTVITGQYVTFEKSPDGLDILKPIPDKIRLLRDEYFSSGVAVGPAAVGDKLIDLCKVENAYIAVYNGSSHPGLATETVAYLKTLGLNVVEEGNTDYTIYSQINLIGSKPYTLKYLVDLTAIHTNRIKNLFDPSSETHISLILGDDWANNNPMP